MPAESLAPTGPWRRLATVFAWLLLLVVMLVTVGPLGLRPSVLDSAQLERFVAFLVLGAAFGVAYPKHPWLILAFVVGAACLFEAAQLLEPHRHGRWPDLMVKVGGGALGVGVAYLVDRFVLSRNR